MRTSRPTTPGSRAKRLTQRSCIRTTTLSLPGVACASVKACPSAGADWNVANGFHQILTDQPGSSAWPITSASFILMHVKQDKPQNAAEVLKFFDWSFHDGQKLAAELDYVPLPDSVTRLIADAWGRQIKDGAGKPVWSPSP